MLEYLLIAGAMVLVYRQMSNYTPKARTAAKAPIVPGKPTASQQTLLLEYAERLLREKKYLSAEKAYLRVLKLDHKNIQAYMQLGYIYTSLKNYPDAIECLQISAQLAPSGAQYQHLGQALFENKNYVRAIAAYEKAIMFEPTASRYLSLARTHQKISNTPKALAELEQAATLEPSIKYLQPLADAYETAGDKTKFTETYRRILEAEPSNARARQIVDAGAKQLETTG